ncbi:MAG TPA: 30S ribosomal protein THX [Mucilaginibacter sp.]|nr:30S ribosomal protein THX [Mucilaginibacter sp.]
MGKGDKKTRKGKIAIGSYGKTRPHNDKKNKSEVAPASEKK